MGSLGRPVAVVADDDEATRRLLFTWLSELGYEVHWVRDGVELLDRLDYLDRAGALTGPFLVVTDLDMPRRNGLAALDLIRERFKDARVLVVTAFGDARLHGRALALGAAYVLQKPFALDRFGELADEVLAGGA